MILRVIELTIILGRIKLDANVWVMLCHFEGVPKNKTHGLWVGNIMPLDRDLFYWQTICTRSQEDIWQQKLQKKRSQSSILHEINALRGNSVVTNILFPKTILCAYVSYFLREVYIWGMRSEIHQLATAPGVLCFFYGGSFEVKKMWQLQNYSLWFLYTSITNFQ